MKRHLAIITTALIVCLSFLTTSAFAIDPIPKESGFSGFFTVGGGYTDMKSNTVAGNSGSDIGKEVISSINNSPESDSTFSPAFNFELKYTFADTRTQLFLGNQLEDLLQYDLTSQAGVRQELGRFGVGSIGFLFSAFPTDVWQDPFLENAVRTDTERTSTGVQLVWDQIFGSNFELQYSFRSIDIDTERSGVSQGLSAADQRLIDRNGDNHQVKAGYRFRIGNKEKGTHIIFPTFQYTTNDRDGDAVSKDGYDLGLSYAYNTQKYLLVLSGSVGSYEADAVHPLYGAYEDSDRYFVSGVFNWKNPMGMKSPISKSWSIYLSGAYGEEDSDITFYDAEVFTSSLGVGFYF